MPTAQECISISKYNTTSLFSLFQDIEQEYMKQYPDYDKEMLWTKFRLYSAVYTAGVLEGKREERAKHHTEGGN